MAAFWKGWRRSEEANAQGREADAVEQRTQALGQGLLRQMASRAAKPWEGAYWQAKLMALCMEDEALKVQLFRLLDVLPALKTEAQVQAHLVEYLGDAGERWWVREGVKALGKVPAKAWAGLMRRQVEGLAGGFIAGTGDPKTLRAVLERLRGQGVGFTVDLLGEACLSEAEADAYLARCLDTLRALTDMTQGWARTGQGAVVNLSVKPSALYSQLDGAAEEASARGLEARLRPLLLEAKRLGAAVNVDIERTQTRGAVHRAVMQTLEAPDLQDGPEVGCVVQAYLRDSEAHLQALIGWAKRTGRRLSIRLVKGAYWDTEVIAAQSNGWEPPVWLYKAETDAHYERLTSALMAAAPWISPVIASHNVRSVAHAMACAEAHGLPKAAVELQTLYGMGPELKAAIAQQGWPVRDYVPVGEVVPGMAYLVRRLLENTSNESWLRRRDARREDAKKLLESPSKTLRRARAKGPLPSPLTDTRRGAPQGRPQDPPFQNEPPRDYTLPAHRAALSAAQNIALNHHIGPQHGTVRCVINGAHAESGTWRDRWCPFNPNLLIGRTVNATPQMADTAIASARAYWERTWRDTTPLSRATILRTTAALMRAQRDLLAALITLEVGKDPHSADADVCEAIDFLEYYAHEALRLATPARLGHFPGEDNRLSYQPRGLVAVIAPWNFPLAILTGMTAAALVTGNAVIMKPAEQSPLIASHLTRLLLAAGTPPAALHLLTGPGEVIGAHIAQHPDIDLIAFTGSLPVGLQLWQTAGTTHPRQRSLKRVICELGGKNATVIDDDADLDEAIDGVLSSAFGYQGQKCSACSRVIVVGDLYAPFCDRLTAAVASLTVAPPTDLASSLGPVIDADAHARLLRAIDTARAEGRVLQPLPIPPDLSGWYIPPTLVFDLDPNSRTAQDELFGPILSIFHAPSFDAALALAASSPYALTASLYSRRPSHIARARDRWRVGNLYINRPSTGALVWRQPFGGSARSGVGSKAGGPDYLLQFLEPKVTTENTTRRGFAPPT